MKHSLAWTAAIGAAIAIVIAVTAIVRSNDEAASAGTALTQKAVSATRPGVETPLASPPATTTVAAENTEVATLLGDGTRRQRLNDIDPGLFARSYRALAELAAHGDVRAAIALSLGVQRCQPAPNDARDLEGAIREIAFRATPGDGDTAIEIERTKALFESCKTLSVEQRQSKRRWIARAAELGDGDARFQFANSPPERSASTDYWAELDAFRATANRYLDEELAKGNRKALLAVSNAYGSDSSVRKPDPVLEYAYLHAYLAAGGVLPDDELQVLEQYQQRLGPAKAKEAVRMGETILRECCNR